MDTRVPIDPFPYDRAFVVQFGSEADVGGGPVVGRAEHIASGRSKRFRSLDELVAEVGRASCRERVFVGV